MATGKINKPINRRPTVKSYIGYSVGTGITVTPVNYDRIAIWIPVYGNANYTEFQPQITVLPAGNNVISSSTFAAPTRTIGPGSSIDVEVTLF